MDFYGCNGLGGEFRDDYYGVVEGSDRDPGLDTEKLGVEAAIQAGDQTF